MLKKFAFYLFATLVIFAGQFLVSHGLVSGKPPTLTHTLSNRNAMSHIEHGPALLYFWADWCGVCRSMQANVNAVLQDYPGVTVALRSGDDEHLRSYLAKNKLAWPTVNDQQGETATRYGVRAVPAVFVIGSNGDILFATVGYSTEIGLRIRLQLAKLGF